MTVLPSVILCRLKPWPLLVPFLGIGGTEVKLIAQTAVKASCDAFEVISACVDKWEADGHTLDEGSPDEAAACAMELEGCSPALTMLVRVMRGAQAEYNNHRSVHGLLLWLIGDVQHTPEPLP